MRGGDAAGRSRALCGGGGWRRDTGLRDLRDWATETRAEGKAGAQADSHSPTWRPVKWRAKPARVWPRGRALPAEHRRGTLYGLGAGGGAACRETSV